MKLHPCLTVFATTLFLTVSALADDSLKVGELTFTAPAPWKLSGTPKPMSQGGFTLPGKDGAPGLDAAFFHFGPGQGGDVDGNIKRWQGMFQADPAAKTTREEMAFGKEKATLITISGTYVGSRFSPEKEPRAHFILLAAVLPSAGGDVFVRCVGPAAAITAATEDLKKLLLTGAK